MESKENINSYSLDSEANLLYNNTNMNNNYNITGLHAEPVHKVLWS